LDWRFARSSSFSLSYDGRRSFRNRLNREVPEEIFDDLLRQGLRASLYVGNGSGLSVTAGGGVRFKEGDEEKTYSFNSGAQHADLWGSGFSAGVNVSGFSNPFTVGTLVILRVGRRLGYASQVDVAYGRSSYEYKATTERRETQWVRLQGRVDVYRGLYLLLDLEYDMGDDLAGPRGLVELGHLF